MLTEIDDDNLDEYMETYQPDFVRRFRATLVDIASQQPVFKGGYRPRPFLKPPQVRVVVKVRPRQEKSTTCNGCGVSHDSFTPGCDTCDLRWCRRIRHGMTPPSNFVRKAELRRCRTCGCHMDASTPGCKSCFTRHYGRKHGRQLPLALTCVACGCDSNEQTPGCEACFARHRRRIQKRRGAPLTSAGE